MRSNKEFNMKKIILLAIIGLSSLVFTNENNMIMTIEEFAESDIFTKLKDAPKEEVDSYISENIDSKVILFLKKGTKIPISISLKGEYLEIKEHSNINNELEIKKDFYLALKDNNMLCSEDLNTWEEVSEFFGGMIGFAISKSDERSPCIDIFGELNKK